MKNIKMLSILIISGAVAFGAKTTVHKANVNFIKAELITTESVTTVMAELVIDSETDVKGVQFDIKFNKSEINSITPQQIDNFNVQHATLARQNSSDSEVIRGLIFSFSGDILNENPKFAVEFAKDYHGTSTIEFVDIILADANGKSIDVDTQSYEINNTDANLMPVKTELTGSYPNPFNPTTSINYSLQNDGHIEIMIYDAAGRLVEELVNGYQKGGEEYSISWNASHQASGMYFAKMVAGDVVQTQKLVLLK